MANNGDELLLTGLKFAGPGSADVVAIGNFHKTLPHNKFGEVDPAAYAQFKLAAMTGGDYKTIPRGYMGGVIPPTRQASWCQARRNSRITSTTRRRHALTTT